MGQWCWQLLGSSALQHLSDARCVLHNEEANIATLVHRHRLDQLSYAYMHTRATS